MTDNTIDLLRNYLLLQPDGAAVLLPGGGDFWSQLMSGDATDPGIRRLLGSEHGRVYCRRCLWVPIGQTGNAPSG